MSLIDETADTRERLMQAAIQQFGARGFGSTTLRDIAQAAGIKAPSIYNHFSSKEELLVAATTWGLEVFQRNVLGGDDPAAPPLHRLEQIVRRHVIFQLDHVEIAQANDLLLEAAALQGIMPSETVDDLRKRMRRHLDLVTDILEALHGARAVVGAPNPRITSLAIISLCDRVVTWYRPQGEFSHDEVAHAYWFLVCGMLRL